MKTLNLVEFLVKNGSERIIDEIRRDQYKVAADGTSSSSPLPASLFSLGVLDFAGPSAHGFQLL